MDLTVQIFKETLRGGSETQRWFDSYAEAFIVLFFRPSILKATESSSTLLDSLQEVFTFIINEIGPKRRGIVSLMSSRLGEYWNENEGALSLHWRAQIMQLLLYGPIRGSADETVAARIVREHVPDSDYQVRVHALSVLNHLKDVALARDFLVDLLGQQQAKTSTKKRMFPGDFGHRLKLRSWSAILLLIGVLCNQPGKLKYYFLLYQTHFYLDFLEKDFVETDLLPTIWKFVGEETMSSTRIFMEWALSRLYLRFPSLIIDDFMSTRVYYRDVAASLVVSMIAISLNMVKRLRSVDETVSTQMFLPKMSDLILPLLVHNNHAVRMHAIHAFKQFEQQKRINNLER